MHCLSSGIQCPYYTSEGFGPLSPGMSALEPVILELDLEQAHLDLGIATTLSYSSFH